MTGEEIIKVDTSFATIDYFNRSIGAAQIDSNAAAVQQLAAKARQKFPKEASFANLLAQSYYKAGQLQQALQAARRATEIDPKSPSPWLFILAIQNQLNSRTACSRARRRRSPPASEGLDRRLAARARRPGA